MPTSGSNAHDGGSPSGAPLPSVLIIDDSRDAADSLGSLFAAHGYPTFVAYHWAVALESAKAKLPDVILLDLGMPEMDGIHLARYFREDEQLKGKLLIAVTGYADKMHRQQCEVAGFDHVLAKPVGWEELEATISRLWAQRTAS